MMQRATDGSDRKIARLSGRELERRWAGVRDHLTAHGLDALIAQDSRDFTGGYGRWLTDVPAGYPRTVVFHASDQMTVVEHGPAGRRRQLGEPDLDNPGVGEILMTAAFPSVHYTLHYDADAIAEVLRHRGYRRVGLVGASGMLHGFVARLTEALSGTVELSDETDAIDRIKAVKSPEEIAMIRRTAEMQDIVLSKVLAGIRPGMRDFEVTALAQCEGQRLGSEEGIFLGSSARLGQPAPFLARHLQGRTLRAGDYVSLLIENNGGGGMYTELARVIVLGKASQELLEGFEIVKEAQAETVRRLRTGTPCREIFAAHNKFLRQHGLPPEARLYAHGQGYGLVERPLVRSDEPMTLENGMNMAVHPSYATSSLFVVICDNYLVEPDGAGGCLHKTPKRVFEL